MYTVLRTVDYDSVKSKSSCGTGTKVARNTSGRDRTKLEISLYTLVIGPNDNAIVEILVRPYKKTFGIWYWSRRTLSYDFKVGVTTSIVSSGTKTHIIKGSKQGFGGKLTGRYSLVKGKRINSYYFAGYDVWGKSRSTGRAILRCNTGIF